MKCLKTAMSNILESSTGQALSRTAPHLISKTQLLQNDRDWDSDVSQLSITAVLEAKGGTVSLTQSGDILFTPDATYTGVMGFKYTVQDAQGNYTQVTSPTGQTVAMKAAVYLQTSDIPNDPLAVEQWYLADTNYYKKRSCLRPYLLGYRHKRISKCAKLESVTTLGAISLSI